MNRNIFTIVVFASLLIGCKDLFEPELENIRNKENIYNEPWFAEGLLANGYQRLEYQDWYTNITTDYATDDAVTNDTGNPFHRMATGQWTVNFNPTDVWGRSYNGILYMNHILDELDKVNWTQDELDSKLFKLRTKGEAHGLRAIFMYNLLQAHGGPVNGIIHGLPIVKEPAGNISNFDIPRENLQIYLDAIYSDLDTAEMYLPIGYGDLNVSSGQVPEKFKAEGITDVAIYNRVLGSRFQGRLNALIAKSFRSRVSLLAASPAFMNGAASSWNKAAQSSAEVLNEKGGLAGLASSGLTWYMNTSEIAAVREGSNPSEIIWRGRTLTHTGLNETMERRHFPPTLNGLGRINPTQNIVDAFPMANGYPITNQNSNYNPASPYANRDPRLGTYVVVHGSTLGPNNKVISMLPGTPTSPNDDAVGATPNSTVTGYYMRKMINPATNLTAATPITAMTYVARIRLTEIFLNYAEAANEAYGPDGMAPGASFSARDVIKAIRQRAKVGGANDPYLASITSKEDMRELIHNERRLELSFEGFRFWDLRRWKVSTDKLNEPVRGIMGTDPSGQITFDYTGPFTLDNYIRTYQPYMIYGPIPQGETIKWSQLLQNDGWR